MKTFADLTPDQKAAFAANLPDKPVECDRCGEMITEDQTLTAWRDIDQNHVNLHIECYQKARTTGSTKWLEERAD